MYILTNFMIQNLEKDLKSFHELFTGGRCESWQLEELIVRAIKSDHNVSDSVDWSGRGHDIKKDIKIIDKYGISYEIQIKSGKFSKNKIIISGHRMGRFKGDLNKIKDFLNSNRYHSFLIPCYSSNDEYGKKFIYKIIYVDSNIFKFDGNWTPDGNGKKYTSINSLGVKFLLHPNMSWQIWWEIPIELLKNRTRDIII